jgi:hypothetical protein
MVVVMMMVTVIMTVTDSDGDGDGDLFRRLAILVSRWQRCARRQFEPLTSQLVLSPPPLKTLPSYSCSHVSLSCCR